MRFDISQGNYEWTDKDYIGKKLGFYRLTAAGAKGSTFAPASADFAVADNVCGCEYNIQVNAFNLHFLLTVSLIFAPFGVKPLSLC